MTLDRLTVIIADSFSDMHDRVAKFEQRMAQNFGTIEERVNMIDARLNGIEGHLAQIEFSVTGQGQRLDILEDRIRQLAAKVGLNFKHA